MMMERGKEREWQSKSSQSVSQQVSKAARQPPWLHCITFTSSAVRTKREKEGKKKIKIKDRRQERANKETALFGRKQLVCAIIMLSCQASDSETAAVRAPSMHSPHNGPSHGLQQHCHGASFMLAV